MDFRLILVTFCGDRGVVPEGVFPTPHYNPKGNQAL